MAPARKRTIQHSTHPGHLLAEVYMNKEYICDGCNTLGYGTRYRCDGCNFDLHEHCGTCPARFSSFMHPRHQLNLIFSHIDRICGVCGDRVEGLYYRCNLCNFDVHPLCTQLPQFVRHAMHPGRPLRLQPSSPTWCMVCKNVCTSWRYRCGVCGVDYHPECVVAPSYPNLGTPPCRPPLPPRPPYGAYAYGLVHSGSNPYNTYHRINQAHGGGATDGTMVKKMTYGVVGRLALGVLTSVVFGLPNFSS